MYGRTSLPQNSVFLTRVSADGSPNYKVGGVTVDWALVAAASGDQTLPDGSIVKDGQKYLRYGQILTRNNANGKFGPYDPNATDGRQTLTRGRCFIVDQTTLQYSSGSSALSPANDIIGGVFDGGSVWFNRILQSGVAAASLAAGPLKADVLTAFPGIQIVVDE